MYKHIYTIYFSISFTLHVSCYIYIQYIFLSCLLYMSVNPRFLFSYNIFFYLVYFTLSDFIYPLYTRPSVTLNMSGHKRI